MKQFKFLPVLLIFLSFLACETTSEDPAPDDNNGADTTDTTTAVVQTNTVEPNANDRMLLNHLWKSNQNSAIYEMIPTGDGNFYFSGFENEKYIVGKLNTEGNPIWQKTLSFRPRQIININTEAVTNGTFLNRALIVAGSSPDDDDIRAYVATYASDGTFLDEENWKEYDKHFFNGVTALSNADKSNFLYFLAVGGGGSSIIYPYSTFFTISKTDGGISKTLPSNVNTNTSQLFTDYANLRFDKYIESNPTIRNQGNRRSTGTITYPEGIYLTSYKRNVEQNTAIISKLTVTRIYNEATKLFEEFTNAIDWNTEVTGTSSNYETFFEAISIGYRQEDFGFGNIFNFPDKIYLVGQTDSEDGKNETPSSGGFWSGGFVAKVDYETGDLIWKKAISNSSNDDFYEACYLEGDNLYAVGRTASFHYTESQNIFGYGWVSKISTETGAVLANYSMGENNYQSGFNTVLFEDGTTYLGGFSEFTNRDADDFKAWFVKLNGNNLRVNNEGYPASKQLSIPVGKVQSTVRKALP